MSVRLCAGPVLISSEDNNELCGSIRSEKFLSYLNDNQLLKNYSSRWRWRDNIKMVLKLFVCEFLDWVHLVPDTDKYWSLVNIVINIMTP
jgi:hypothetical protein